jgi:HSP20 family protein
MYAYDRDLNRAVRLMDQLRRRMDRVFDDFDDGRGAGYEPGGDAPRTNLYDAGSSLVLTAELPGLTASDLSVTLNQDVLTLSGERKSDAPEGYASYRQERAPYKFSRSYALPAKVDPEKVSAKLVSGVLTLVLEKAPEVKPRQITVRAS